MRSRIMGALAGTLLGFLLGCLTCGVHNQTNFFLRHEDVTVCVVGIPIHQESGPSGTAAAVGDRFLPPLIAGWSMAGLLGGLAVGLSFPRHRTPSAVDAAG